MTDIQTSTDYNFPDISGKFGIYGGKFVPETLITPLEELEAMYKELKDSDDFINEVLELNKEYTGRPTPLTFAKNLTDYFGKAKIYLKEKIFVIPERIKSITRSDKFYSQRNLGKQES